MIQKRNEFELKKKRASKMKLFDILIVMMNLKKKKLEKKMVHRLAKNRRFTENNCVHMQTFLYMFIRALVSVYRAT